MRFSRRQRPDPSINLTSLIDILFIVLLFLVLTTAFRGASVVDVDLPPAATGEQVSDDPRDTVRVTVSRDGRLYVSQRPVTLAELRDVLTAAAAARDPHVLLEADARAEHGRVVEVMDLARQVGLSRLSIETTRTDLR